DPSSDGILRRLERLERGDGGGASAPPPPAPPKADEPAEKTPVEEADEPEPEPEVEDAAAEPSGGASPRSLDFDEVVRIWPAVLDSLRQSAPALATTFEGARPVEIDEEGLTVGFPAGSTFNKRKAEAPDRREQFVDAFESVAGTRLRPH